MTLGPFFSCGFLSCQAGKGEETETLVSKEQKKTPPSSVWEADDVARNDDGVRSGNRRGRARAESDGSATWRQLMNIHRLSAG